MIAAVLAAGEAKRFGRCKQIALLAGKPLLQHVINALPPAMKTVIVTGGYHTEVSALAESLGVPTIYNSEYKLGMGASLKCAVRFAAEMQKDLLVTLADLPYVTRDDYLSLCQGYQDRPVFSKFSDDWGPPAIFPQNTFTKLLAMQKGRGAKGIFTVFDKVVIENAARDIDFDF